MMVRKRGRDDGEEKREEMGRGKVGEEKWEKVGGKGKGNMREWGGREATKG